MENEKKSSRLGVRLSAFMVAVLLVVCMAVPAFAYELSDLPGEWVFSEVIDCDTTLRKYGQTVVSLTCPAYFIVDGQKRPVYSLAFRLGDELTYRETGTNTNSIVIYQDGSWVNDAYRYIYITGDALYPDNSILGAEAFFLNAEPVPPDLKENVTSGLTIVLDWVGATVSALFSGSLSGLLPLVAVPVAITLLLVAIIVIKRSIWGA